MSKLGKFAAACAAVVCAFGATAAEVAKYYEYVETNNEKTKGVYVLLDYTPKSDSVVEASVEILDIDNTGTLFCSRGSSTSEKTFTLFSVGTSGLRWDYNRTDAIYWKIGANEKHDIRATNKGLFADGDTTAKIAATPAATPYTAGNKMTLFGSYTAAKGTTPKPTDNFAKMRLYSFKAYDLEDGELVLKLDLRPCVDTDGNAALYDAVNERLYYAEAGTSGKTMTVGGAALDKTLQIAGNPMNVGEVSPAYGQHAGYSAGESYPLSAPAVWTNAEETVAATCIGYKVYTNDVVYVEGSGNSFTYEHPDCEMGAMLVWQWAFEYKVTALAETGGTVEPAEQWVAEGEQATVMATCDDTHDFRKWDVEPNGASHANPLSIVVTAPAVATARFQDKNGIERTWKGGATGDWDVPANWEPEGVPDSGDDVVIATKNAAVSATNRIVVKSITLTDATLKIGSSADRTAFVAEVAGNLTLNGASKLYVFAKTFSDLSVFADYEQAMATIWANRSAVEIGGTFAVNGTSVVYPDNDPLTGTPVVFTASDFTLASGATFDTVNRGWDWKKDTVPEGTSPCVEGSYYTFAFGPGRSFNSAGGAYGGNSNAKTTSGGKKYGYAYGYQYAPFLPGSPNGCHSTPARGSGSICIFATGHADIKGKLNANGKIANMYGAPSGGGIWIAARTMAIAQGAELTAIGDNTGYVSSGGGGRISLGVGLSSEQVDALATGAEPEGLSFGSIMGVSANVRGGTYSSGAGYSPSGTATVVADKSVSVPMWITATPTEYENGNLAPNYGFYAYEAASIPAPTAPAGTYPAFYEGFRRLVNECAVTNDEAAVRTVTWRWGNEECLVRFEPRGKGKITVNGIDYTTSAEAWFASGTELTLTATPEDGDDFVTWAGDFPGMISNETSFAVVVDKSMTIDALFTGATFAQKTFVGETGGSWHIAANWEPAGVPTLADDVLLDGKTVFCNGIALAHSLAQASGTLVIGGNGTTVEAQTERTDVYVPWAALYVSGDVTLSGGGFSLGARRTAYTCFGALIGGNLTVSGSGKAAFYAPESAQADFASLYANAMKVKVGGAFSVGDTATVYAEVDGLSGTPVKFEVVGDVTVGETAKVCADARGWHWYAYDSQNPDPRPERHVDGSIYTLCPGYGSSYTVGGAYGLSGETDSNLRRPFGYLYAPYLSGGACAPYGNAPSRAGGQIWIETLATLTLDGTLTANASEGGGTRADASGGGIWLCAKKLVAGSSAKLLAKGGNGSGAGTYSGGTGGRISVALGVTPGDLEALAHGEEPENLAYAQTLDYGTYSVAGGYNRSASGISYYAPDGTVSTVVGEVDEYDLTVQSSPLSVLAENLEYTTYRVAKGASWSRTVGAVGYDPANPDSVRYVCEGWVVSNTTEEVAHGADSTASFTATKGPFALTWHWGVRETLAKVVPNDPELGGVSVNGAAATPTADVWTRDTDEVTLTAEPNAGAEFVCWYGDVPLGKATERTLTLGAAVSSGLKPVFRKVAEPTNYVWQVADGKSGNWEDAANWDPANVPGLADTVTISNGTCMASNYAACAVLRLSGKGALKVGVARSAPFGEAVLKVVQDMTLADSANLTVNDDRGSFLHEARVDVGGNLTMDGNSTFAFGAGPTNAVSITLATGSSPVTVGGRFTVDGKAKVTVKGDPWTGGSAVFRVGEFVVTSNATVSAVGGGHALMTGTGVFPVNLAPGYGANHSVGGGYGGRGRDVNDAAGLPYGFAMAPIHPGSQMGDYRYGYDYRGGGLIRVHAAGRMTLNGIFDADCNNRTYNNSSGGGIWLTAGDRVAVGEKAVFRARGGTGATVGVGGGGRISVCQFISPAQADRMALDGEYHGVGRAAKHVFGRDEFRAAFGLPETAVNLSNGANTEAEPYGGSFTYIDGTPSGLMLIVR